MSHFTAEQLAEIAAHFSLTPKKTLPVRDGRVDPDDMVWWRASHGPDHVRAGEHITNITRYPELYSIAKPLIRVVEYRD